VDNYNCIDIVTSFALFDGIDDEPILKALKSHNGNRKVKSLHIITESKQSELNYLLEGLDNLQVHFVEVESRPTFNVLISYINELLVNKTSKNVVLINGDVSFENEVSVDKITKVFNEKGTLPNTVLAISRHENIAGKVKMALYLDNGLPNFMSADAWVFNTPCYLDYAPLFNMGQMNCDLMLAYDLVESGYEVMNPCLDVVIVHHESEIKSGAFYAELNATERNINAGYQHLASRVNNPQKFIGTAWIKSTWIKSGYNPAPYEINNPFSIWLYLNHDITESLDQYLVMILEIIAKASSRDLIILIDGEIRDELVEYYKKSLCINNKIYLVSIKDVDNFAFNNLTGEFSGYDSCIIMSDLSRLTNNILNTNSMIYIDLKSSGDQNKLSFLSKDVLGLDLRWYLSERYGLNIENIFNILDGQYIRANRSCSLISSVFKSDDFIDTFVDNCSRLNSYKNIDHYYMVSNLSEHEKIVFNNVLSTQINVIFVWHKQDPGLYECWNRGIKLAITKYVSNANVDDLRDSFHVNKLVASLESNDKYSFSASALHPFYEFSGDLQAHKLEHPWYSDQQGDIKFRQLGFAEKKESGQYKIKPHNLPHCMPIWCKSLHDKYGYFDEESYGTFADWAFWLKITLHDEVGYLHGEGLGFYYVNLESHNRRGEKLEMFHQKIEKEFLPHFLLGNELFKQLHSSRPASYTPIVNKQLIADLPKKLNIHGVDLSYGEHRNSFNKLAESLLPLHTNQNGILFLPFIERYFVWGQEPGEANSDSPTAITQDWIGIIHVPFDAPSWFHTHVSPEIIFETELWKNSLSSCKGLITLSDDLERDINFRFPDLATFSLKHPTEFDDLQPFNIEQFNENPTLVQAGDWLRNLQAIHKVEAPKFRRIMLKKTHTDAYLNNEIGVFGDFIDSDVEIFTMIPNEEYDALLSSSVVLCWLYATAANNLILECIARKTPIIINPLPSVVEYLGKEYPLYIDDLSEVKSKLENKNLIKEAHEYLANKKFRNIYSYQRFFENFSQSEFYSKL